MAINYTCDPCVCPEEFYRDNYLFKRSIIKLLCDVRTNTGSGTGGLATEATLAALNAKFNSLGQKTMAGSAPVVIASNQTAVPVSGTITAVVVGVATEATLLTINGKITACDTGNVTVTSSALPTGAATEATLASIDTTLNSDAAGGLYVRPIPGANTTVTQVPAAIANTNLLAANVDRKWASFYNDSDSPCYLKLGAIASSASYTVRLFPNGFFEMQNSYIGVVDCIWDSATGNMLVTELT